MVRNNMKLFVVTSGEYSDYGIDRIFLDEEKAKNYVKYHSRDFGGVRIEEWTTDDDSYQIIASGWYRCYGSIRISQAGLVDETSLKYLDCVLEDSKGKEDTSLCTYNSPYTLSLIRYFPEGSYLSEEDVKNVVKKTLIDLAHKIGYYLTEGYTIEDVRELLCIEKW